MASHRYNNYQNRKFTEFKTKVRKHLPKLAQRVFALRGTPGAMGYDLEKDFGKVLIYTASSYWPELGKNEYHSMFIVIEIIVRGMFRDLHKAEKLNF